MRSFQGALWNRIRIGTGKRRFLQNEFWVVAKSAGELTDDHLPSMDAP
jgi:hypothetical protein